MESLKGVQGGGEEMIGRSESIEGRLTYTGWHSKIHLLLNTSERARGHGKCDVREIILYMDVYIGRCGALE